MGNYLIIGGSSGIGASIVQQLAKQDNTVFASFHTSETQELENVKYFKHDVLNDKLNTDLLPDRINGVVYCPGSINLKPFKLFSREDFNNDFNLQVSGAIDIIKTVLPNLKKADHPSIIFFSTVAVQKGFPFHAQVAASKGAIEGLTKSLAAEFAPKIRVNAIAPSLTDTPLAANMLSSDEKRNALKNKNPLKTIGHPDDVAAMAVFLLSEKAKWVTGQIIGVDGGMSTLQNN